MRVNDGPRADNRREPITGDREVKGLSIKAVCISIIALIVLVWYNRYAEYTRLRQPIEVNLTPSVGALAIVLLLMGLNFIVRKVFKRRGDLFTRGELLSIYVMVGFGAFIGSWGLMAMLPAQVMTLGDSGVLYHAQTIGPFFEAASPWWLPKSTEAVVGFYLGSEQVGLQGVPWGEWIGSHCGLECCIWMYIVCLHVFINAGSCILVGT